MPGNFIVNASQHPFLAGESRRVGLPALPVGLTPRTLELTFAYKDLKPVVGAPFTVLFDDGTQREGTLDDQGQATVDNPPGPGRVFFGYDRRDAFPYPERPDNPAFGLLPASPDDASQALARYAQAEAEFMQDNYFPDEVAALYSDERDYEDLTAQYDYVEETEPDDHDDGDPGTHDEVRVAGSGDGTEAQA